jgi:hypothetical protein
MGRRFAQINAAQKDNYKTVSREGVRRKDMDRMNRIFGSGRKPEPNNIPTRPVNPVYVFTVASIFYLPSAS